MAGAAVAQPISAEFAQRWVAHDEPLELRVDADSALRLAELRFFAGTSDVTALLRRPEPARVVIEPAAGGWAAGEGEFVVWRVADEQWQELLRVPLRVRTATGFDTSQTSPTAELQLQSRAAENRNDGQPVSPRGTANDLAGRGGLAWTGTRGDWRTEAQLNLAGASFRGAALRYSQLQDRAPKLDLADWRFVLARGDHAIEAGHVQWGSHPLLIQGLSTRGVAARARLAPWLDIGASALQGKPVTGYDDLVGLNDSEQRSDSVTLGVELIADRPGGLRAELTWVDASQRPERGFEVGEVGDAERSRGLGLRLLGSSPEGRVRGELAVARSRFTNPFDPLLALGDELQPVAPVTALAHVADLQVELLRQAEVGRHKLDFGVGMRHERAAPLYRSIGAFVTADQALTRLQWRAAIAGAQLTWQLARREDNLDGIATVLANRTDENGLTLNLPLPAWFAAEAGATSAWPTVAATWQDVHQRAINTPATEDSGIAATHRPDQKSRSQQLNLGWSLGPASLAYTLARSNQDNRQPGRERADFRNLGHQVSVSGPLGDAWRANLALNRSRNLAAETGLVTWTTGGSFGLDWQASERLAVAANISHNLGDDSDDRNVARSTTAQLQTNWRFDLPGPGPKLPGQAYLRVARQGDTNRDRVFGLASDWRAWWVDIGVSVALQ
ncbi:MAG: hypothetical protein U5L05_03040 [Rubrivivax sp.]|nr:hypothetical protein [Rubrivivax sp.]